MFYWAYHIHLGHCLLFPFNKGLQEVSLLGKYQLDRIIGTTLHSQKSLRYCYKLLTSNLDISVLIVVMNN